MSKEKNNHWDIKIPEVSSFRSRKEWEEGCWQKILGSRRALELIITPHERHDLVMRVAALNFLETGKSYRQIGRELWLSPQTISGIKKSSKEGGYRSYSERSKKERKPKNYSPNKKPRSTRPEGIPRPTKYGTIYIRPIK